MYNARVSRANHELLVHTKNGTNIRARRPFGIISRDKDTMLRPKNAVILASFVARTMRFVTRLAYLLAFIGNFTGFVATYVRCKKISHRR